MDCLYIIDKVEFIVNEDIDFIVKKDIFFKFVVDFAFIDMWLILAMILYGLYCYGFLINGLYFKLDLW